MRKSIHNFDQGVVSRLLRCIINAIYNHLSAPIAGIIIIINHDFMPMSWAILLVVKHIRLALCDKIHIFVYLLCLLKPILSE